MSRRIPRFRILVVLSVLFGVGLALANVVLGPLNQDEGWYLAAARCVAHGLVPYRDFVFSQAPGLPVVYGFLSRLWDLPGSPLGPLLHARLLTACLGLAASAFAAVAAARWAPRGRGREAALLTWLLTACSPVHSYFCAIPKTYALAALFLTAGFLCLTAAGRVRSAAFGGGVALGLAAATRHSLVLAAPAACLSLWLAAPHGERRKGFRTAVFCGIGVVFALGCAFAPVLHHPDNVLFSLSYHSVRDIPGLVPWLSLRAGFLSRLVQGYPLLFLVAVAVAMTAARRRTCEALRPTCDDATRAVRVAAWTSALAISAAHFLAPFPYDDYQTPVMPLLAAVLAATLPVFPDSRTLGPSDSRTPAPSDSRTPAPSDSRTLAPSDSRTPAPSDSRTLGPSDSRTLALPLWAVLLALGSPLLMDWMVVRKDRLWIETKPKPDVLVLRDVGRRIRALADASGDDTPYLLTQDAYLAVESGLPLPRGLEMGPFSYFPHLSNEDAKRHRVHNEATVLRMIRSPYAPVLAATSGYAFAIDCPTAGRVPEAERRRLLDEIAFFYEPVGTVPDFGQAHTELTLWRRKSLGREPDTGRAGTGGAP